MLWYCYKWLNFILSPSIACLKLSIRISSFTLKPSSLRRMIVHASTLSLHWFYPIGEERFLRFYPCIVLPLPREKIFMLLSLTSYLPLARRRDSYAFTSMSKPSLSWGKHSHAPRYTENEGERSWKSEKRKDFGTVFSMPTWPTGLSIRVGVFGKGQQRA